ncbi:hypothetical protein UlMin_029194 [Ulmus minor]
MGLKNLIFFQHLMLIIHSLFHFAYMQPLCHEAESSALLSFKESFIIKKCASLDPSAYPKFESWNEWGDCCSWDGIQCDEETGYVISLDLSSSLLKGSINSNNTLFHLSHLQSLSLADNDFSYSQIPERFSQLSKLVHLNLSASKFSGEIPFEISHLSKLFSLDLSLNLDSPTDLSLNLDPPTDRKLLELKIPVFRSLLSNLSSLAQLDLSFVNINSVVPSILANFSSLTAINLTGCGLQGEFPIEVFHLPNLQYLNVRSNPNLTGILPEFYSSSPLKSLRLGDTRFFGKLPISISNLKDLNELRVFGCHFSGLIPSSLGNLTQLMYLDLARNSFSGHVPSSLQNLAKLKYLQLKDNNFSNLTLSWIGKLAKLNLLDLTKTNLREQIPISFTNLTLLSTLALAQNQLTGPIPIWLMNLTQLTDLYLSQNNLRGTIELETFFKLRNLAVLRLSHNQLSLIPENTSNATLPELQFLELASCNLKKFPNFVLHHSKLQLLDLSCNKIRGSIPAMARNQSKEALWSNIEFVNLRSNELQGSLPIPPPSTIVYSISNNHLTGEIPHSFCALSSLYALDLSNNNLSGKLPPCLGNSSNSLTILMLQNNNLHGSIPGICTKQSKLIGSIDLSNNHLQGPLPRSLASCRKLEFLLVGNNLIKDTFPSWLSTLSQLKVVILRGNEFYGAVKEFTDDCSFSKLLIIDLSQNNFSGPLPLKYIKCWDAMKVVDAPTLTYMQLNSSFQLRNKVNRYKKVTTQYWPGVILTNKGIKMVYQRIPELLAAIDLSSNNFEGEVPELIGSLVGLRLLNLSNNNLMGLIPSSLGNLRNLESLDLSRNKLSGEIPQTLGALNFLSYFDVSYNQLSGPIPKGGQFDTFPDSSFANNLGLLTKRKPENPEISAPTPSASSGSSSSVELDWKFVVSGYASGLVVGIVIEQMVVRRRPDWILRRWKRRSSTGRTTWISC